MKHKNIWLFGDSYAGDVVQDLDIPLYYNVLKKHYLAELHNHGRPGSSLQYMYDKFNYIRCNFEKNDIVIICLTEVFRQYFFENRPQISMAQEWALSLCDEPERNAIHSFFKILHNGNNDFVNLLNFMYNLEDISTRLDLRTIVLTMCNSSHLYGDEKSLIFSDITYSSVTMATGFLNSISRSETSDSKISDLLYRRTMYPDPRPNHLCISNHKILAQKIIDNIDDGCPIDLTTGFLTDLLTVDSLNDENFRNTELRPNTSINQIPETLRI